MGKRKGIESSIALADAAAMCRVDGISAYPITPQTHIVEHLSEWVNDGKLDAEFVPVDSEHSAMSAACGLSSVGARTFTATSSQGLALMHEILFIASSMRFPMVMAVANRALSAPISIWNDHSDIMAERDIGWIQLFAENGQECFDLTPLCFRVSEDKRVVLPSLLNFDGFIVSHMIEPIEYWDQEQFDAFLPPFEPQIRLDVKNPTTMGVVGVPEIYYETKMVHHDALRKAKAVVKEGFAELEKTVGRKYEVVEKYKADDAEVALTILGSLAETAMTAVDNLRKKGHKVGLVRPRLWRPFPDEEFIEAVSNIPVLGVADRAYTFGAAHHPVASEVKSVLFNEEKRPKVLEFVLGIGGRDVKVEEFEEMFMKMIKVKDGAKPFGIEYVGVR
ncbi:MAG: pyruvate ferredoxin oxidoreductase [Deltaproteobacteria bacterium]|jgi:pyruvate ferredoxin oxidoreductase alpha subunit|nr:pyruvate ferredoxin oxidoreductase [Deltaproteobacteria bacterium]